MGVDGEVGGVSWGDVVRGGGGRAGVNQERTKDLIQAFRSEDRCSYMFLFFIYIFFNVFCGGATKRQLSLYDIIVGFLFCRVRVP